jgi:beta-glucanase (GH16 family)
MKVSRHARPLWLPVLPALCLLAWARLCAATPVLIWSDEFNQAENSAPDSTKWTFDLGGGGWGNDELETYTNSRDNSYIASDPAATDGRVLVIQAVKAADSSYKSARLKTQGLFNVNYGRVEARLKTSDGDGLWPAFWMLGTNITGVGWPTCGEIDIMEILGRNPGKLYGTLHGPGYSGAHGIGNTFTLPGGASFSDAYHEFAVEWSPDRIIWTVDGTVYHTVTPENLPSGTSWVFNNSPFFIILDFAVGGLFPGSPDATTPFPATYRIDYVRVYGLAPSAPTAASASAPKANGQASLAWNAPADLKGFALTGYRLERGTDNVFLQNTITLDLGVGTAYTDTALTLGQPYYYRVSAVTSGGTSDPSVVFSVTPPLTDPTPTPAPAPAPTHGGGGGVITPWFLVVLSLLRLARRITSHQR